MNMLTRREVIRRALLGAAGVWLADQLPARVGPSRPLFTRLRLHAVDTRPRLGRKDGTSKAAVAPSGRVSSSKRGRRPMESG